MAFDIVASRSLAKSFARTPPRIAQAIREKLMELAKDPGQARLDIKPLRAVDGQPPVLRLRLANYRVLLQIDVPAKQIIVLRVGPRATVYRGLNSLDV